MNIEFDFYLFFFHSQVIIQWENKSEHELKRKHSDWKKKILVKQYHLRKQCENNHFFVRIVDKEIRTNGINHALRRSRWVFDPRSSTELCCWWEKQQSGYFAPHFYYAQSMDCTHFTSASHMNSEIIGIKCKYFREKNMFAKFWMTILFD